MKVGIPRAGLYYSYHLFWTAFFESLGIPTVVSDKTDRRIMNLGLSRSHTEMCLPVKLCYGHILSVLISADCVLLPQFEDCSYSNDNNRQEFFCPYFVAMADMIRAEYPEIKILRPTMKLLDGEIVAEPWLELAAQLGYGAAAGKAAYDAALRAWRQGNKEARDDKTRQSKKIIAVIGRPYLVHDEFANLEIMKKIKRAGYEVLTLEQLSEKEVDRGFKEIAKTYHYHWRLANQEYGAIISLSRDARIKGIIYLTPFNCGPDFLMETVAIRPARQRKPVVIISLDESSGEAGVMTRLDAFFDMIR